jgi:uncharacterized protein YndB with AHSA1/START domain
MTAKTTITVEATVNAPAEKVWELWTSPKAITEWNSATPEWHTPRAEHDLKPGGSFNYRMEAKDGSFGFDFGGVFDEVNPPHYLEYTIGDGRKVKITFTANGDQTHISQSFEAESVNPVEMQQGGWQAILNNFKQYAEA